MAIKKLTGVKTSTMAVIKRLFEIINASVTRIAITPEKNWVKPRRSPSESSVASAVIRLTRSPVL